MQTRGLDSMNGILKVRRNPNGSDSTVPVVGRACANLYDYMNCTHTNTYEQIDLRDRY